MFFRGYADQGLQKLFYPGKLAAFCVSAALFSLWHMGNGDMLYGWLPYLLDLFAFGLLMSFLTDMDQGLEAAIGIHAANNLIYFLFLGSDVPYAVPTALFSIGDPLFTFQSLAFSCLAFISTGFVLTKLKIGIGQQSFSNPPTGK